MYTYTCILHKKCNIGVSCRYVNYKVSCAKYGAVKKSECKCTCTVQVDVT